MSFLPLSLLPTLLPTFVDMFGTRSAMRSLNLSSVHVPVYESQVVHKPTIHTWHKVPINAMDTGFRELAKVASFILFSRYLQSEQNGLLVKSHYSL